MSLASAARAGFPSAATAKTLFALEHGDVGIALVRISDSPTYAVEVFCQRTAGGWVGLSESNGPGWRPTHEDAGAITSWGEAPAGKETVSVEFGGRKFECPVREGYYLFIAWDVPDPGESYQEREPKLIAHRS